MGNVNEFSGPFTYREPKWSAAEKAIARRVFDGALQRELDGVMQTAKQMARKIESPPELWTLEEYLTKSRKEIDRKYDYRYSVLPMVFGQLFREGRIQMEDLQGLAEDKLNYVRLVGSFVSEGGTK